MANDVKRKLAKNETSNASLGALGVEISNLENFLMIIQKSSL